MFTKAQKKQVVRCWKAVNKLSDAAEIKIDWEVFPKWKLLRLFLGPEYVETCANDPRELEFLRRL